MTVRDALWETIVEHKKTPFIPMYDYNVIAGVGGMRAYWELGPAGGGLDGFGVAWEGTVSAGGAGVPLGWPIVLKDITAWEDQVRFPDLDAIPWQSLVDEWLAGVDRETRLLNWGAYNAQFERVTHLMGFMDGLCAFTEEPEACEALLNAITDYKIAELERIKQYFNPHFYTAYDDVATQLNLFISPGVYRELIKPQHKRVNDACRAMGIVPILHCCGKCESLIEDFIDEGNAAWISAQPMNDIAAITARYGDRITVIGGYDSNGRPGTMEASDAEVEWEVRRCLDEYGHSGSYVFSGFRMGGETMEEEQQPIEAAYAKYLAQHG